MLLLIFLFWENIVQKKHACTLCECCKDGQFLDTQSICCRQPKRKRTAWMDGWMCTSGHACFAALHNVFGNLPNHFWDVADTLQEMLGRQSPPHGWRNPVESIWSTIINLQQSSSIIIINHQQSSSIINLQQSSSIMSNHYVHLWTKQVVGFLGGSHHNWDHFPSSNHVEELLSYVIRAVVILKRKVEPLRYPMNLVWYEDDEFSFYQKKIYNGDLYWSSEGSWPSE